MMAKCVEKIIKAQKKKLAGIYGKFQIVSQFTYFKITYKIILILKVDPTPLV